MNSKPITENSQFLKAIAVQNYLLRFFFSGHLIEKREIKLRIEVWEQPDPLLVNAKVVSIVDNAIILPVVRESSAMSTLF